jgi:hypothetical protein
MRKFQLLLLLTGFLHSCMSTNVSEEIKLTAISEVKKNCYSLKGKEVFLKAEYLGWKCTKDCKHPGLTRSDTCIADKSGCIYLFGTGKLNPIVDRGKEFIFKGKVELSPYNNTCYIRVERVNEVK